MHTTSRRVSRLLVAAALALVAGACGADATTATSEEVAALRSRLQETQRRNEQLVGRLDRMESRIEGLTQDIDRLAHESVRAARAGAPEAATPGDSETVTDVAPVAVPSAPPEALVDLLESEAGQEIVANAMRAVEERRDAARRERMVTAMVDRFAEMAALTPQQTEDASRIVADSMRRMGEVWSSMRDSADLSADERAQLREESMVKMEEIRQVTNDEMKAILNSEQYAIYEEQASRMRGFGGRRGGGRGR